MSSSRAANWWLAASALAGAAIISAGALLSTYGPSVHFGAGLSNAGNIAGALAPFPIAFVLGACLPRWAGLLAVAVTSISVELTQGYVNPFVLVVLFGPWLVGAIFRDRRHLAQQLQRMGEQLQAESNLLAEESVRYERARIARELHDIVAHCVSVMVVQAYAGERLATRDQSAAAEAFDHISEAAVQAQFEIGHLVDLLGDEPPVNARRRLDQGVGELVAGAVATGLSVKLTVRGDTERLPAATSLAAYRVVQESITNALKHAPGAPIDVTVNSRFDLVCIDVVNSTSPSTAPPSLQASGGGHGLAGMRDRTTALGGRFEAGPDGNGSWRVSVRLPVTG
jgi:signal transduction histidine kinase